MGTKSSVVISQILIETIYAHVFSGGNLRLNDGEKEVDTLRLPFYTQEWISREVTCEAFELPLTPVDQEPLGSEFHDEPLGIVSAKITYNHEATWFQETVELLYESA